MSHDDFIGEKYGRLTVLSEVPKEERIGGSDARRRAQFLCECECGNKLIVTQANLASGRTVSCGCFHREMVIAAATTHGLTSRELDGDQPRLYHIWRGMKQRCYKPNTTNYARYGGRGITVCDEWRNSFEAFHTWAMSHGYRDDLTIDRINNDGPYCPENCHWVTMKDQARNTRRSHKFIYCGKEYTMKELANLLGVSNYKITTMWYRGELQDVNEHLSGPFSDI